MGAVKQLLTSIMQGPAGQAGAGGQRGPNVSTPKDTSSTVCINQYLL